MKFAFFNKNFSTSNIIRFLTIFIFVCFLTNYAAAQSWELFHDSPTRKYYIDSTSITEGRASLFSTADPDINFNVRVEYLEPMVTKYGKYGSGLNAYAISCKNNHIAMTDATAFDLSGNVAGKWSFGKQYKSIDSDRLNVMLFDIVCNKKLPRSVLNEAESPKNEDTEKSKWVQVTGDDAGRYLINIKAIRDFDLNIKISSEKSEFTDIKSFEYGKYIAIIGSVYYHCTKNKIAYGSELYIGSNGKIIKSFGVTPPTADADWKDLTASKFDADRFDIVCNGNLNKINPIATNEGRARSGRKSGSGFFANTDGFIITNHHVIEDCNDIQVIHNKKITKAQLVAHDPVIDLALLNTNIPSLGVPFRRNSVVIGDAAYASGYPLDGILTSDLVFTSGIVSATSGIGSEITRFQISTPIQPGNSGGPLLDDNGSLSGVVVSKLNAAVVAAKIGDIPQNVNFAIKNELVRLFLDSNNVKYEVIDRPLRLTPSAIAERSRSYTVKITCDKR